MQNIYCIVGKSGTGKDTVVNRLCKDYGYKRVVSCTTRKPRIDPNDVSSHFFTTVEDYHKAKISGSVVAETNIEGNCYWVTKDQVDMADLYIVDPKGLRELRQLYNGKPIVGIWIGADEDVRRERMKRRGDSNEAIEKRIKADNDVFGDINKGEFDLFVSNNQDGNLKELCKQIHEQITGIEKTK